MVGLDFEKIEIDVMGFHLMEPNTFIGDIILFITALLMANKTTQLNGHNSFFKNFKWFFIMFGFTFLAGGLGHLFFNYWGVQGKYTGWYLGIFSSWVLEFTLISIFPDQKLRKLFQRISIVKMLLAFGAETWVFNNIDLIADPSLGLKVPSLNAAIGQCIVLGVLGYYYEKKINNAFRFFWISLLVIVPSVIAQALNLNLAQWFDKNDIGHVFLLIALLFYFKALNRFSESLQTAPEVTEEVAEEVEASLPIS